MAARLLAVRLAALGVEAAVMSAGFGPAGEPATPDAVAVMAEIGLDLRDHQSRLVTTDLCHEADLSIGMTRQHVIDLVLLAPSAWPRIFPLVDLVRRSQSTGPVKRGESAGAWVRRIHGDRKRGDVMRLLAGDEIDDPTGLSRLAYQHTRDQLNSLVTQLAARLAALAVGAHDAPVDGDDMDLSAAMRWGDRAP